MADFSLTDSTKNSPLKNIWGNVTLSKILASNTSQCNSVFTCNEANTPKIYKPTKNTSRNSEPKVKTVTTKGVTVDCENPQKVLKPELIADCSVPARTSSPVIESKYSDTFEKYAKQYNVDSNIVKAIGYTESKFNPKAHSGNAKGIMQISHDIAKQKEIKNRFNPEENINAGCAHFADLLKLYDGDYQKALAAYKAGVGNVNKHGISPRSMKYINYIKKLAGGFPNDTNPK